jgi:rod shape determining protein RodA
MTPRSFRLRGNPTSPWRHIDWALASAAVAIAGLGLLMVYSATHRRLEEAGLDPYNFLKRQAIWTVLGLAALVITVVVDYRVFRDFAPVVYGASALLLLAVLSPLGSTSKGTQSWFQLGPYQLQPSEYAKVGLIVGLATYCAAHRGDLDAARLGRAIGIAALPMALIYLQPDVGTVLVFVAVMMGVLLVAGARPRHLVVLGLVGIIGVIGMIQIGVLKEYQLDRLGAFLDPEDDTQLAAYNQDQSKTAIGAGGLTGRGLFKGTQTNLSYVPEQHTDFIFTAVGEQLGFLGAVTLLAIFGLVVWRTWRAAILAKDLFGTFLCVGVLAMLVFQIFENVGMTMGIMPVTGIPLPFLSYGGSSTVTCFIALGLVLNVHMRRFT